MKLTIIRLQQFSSQDRIDLEKIWPQADIVRLECQLDDRQHLYAARFNDRLLAAVKLRIDGEEGQLSQCVVREVTRRRGVGLYLLEEVMEQNPAIRRWAIAADGSETPAVTAAFVQAAGFTQQGERWVR